MARRGARRDGRAGVRARPRVAVRLHVLRDAADGDGRRHQPTTRDRSTSPSSYWSARASTRRSSPPSPTWWRRCRRRRPPPAEDGRRRRGDADPQGERRDGAPHPRAVHVDRPTTRATSSSARCTSCARASRAWCTSPGSASARSLPTSTASSSPRSRSRWPEVYLPGEFILVRLRVALHVLCGAGAGAGDRKRARGRGGSADSHKVVYEERRDLELGLFTDSRPALSARSLTHRPVQVDARRL